MRIMALLRSSPSPREAGKYICRSCSRQIWWQRRSFANAVTPEIYDVVNIGGGPAGLSFLAALRMLDTS